jgi:hypothetical protein
VERTTIAGETEVLGENLPSATLSHHKSHMTRSGFEPRTAAVGSQWLTAWAMARPKRKTHSLAPQRDKLSERCLVWQVDGPVACLFHHMYWLFLYVLSDDQYIPKSSEEADKRLTTPLSTILLKLSFLAELINKFNNLMEPRVHYRFNTIHPLNHIVTTYTKHYQKEEFYLLGYNSV